MKHLRPYSLYIVFIFFFLSCTTSKTAVQVVRPPDITLPSAIRTIAIVDRTLIDKKHKLGNTIEGLASGEHAGQDRLAEQEVLSGLNTVLQTSPTVKATLTGIQLTGSGKVSAFPMPLDSAEVRKICDQYQVDAIAVLELFDSDCSGRTAFIKIGFRVYSRNYSIADQHYFTYRTKWKRSHSMSASRSNSTRFSESNAINQAAYEAGVNYGRRIAATMITARKKQ